MFPIQQLFPFCTSPDCPQAATPHHHVFPHQQAVLDSTSKYLGEVGGFGSGKTVNYCARGLLLSLAVHHNRGIIVRRTLTKLHDTTQRIFMEVLDRAAIDGVEYKENRDGYSHRIILPNGSEIVFRPSEDIGRFLGPEYGWFLIDEAVEEPESTFTLLIGRLRLVQAARYLCGMVITNPPPKGHWFYQQFGENPGITLKGRSAYQFFRSSSRLNPNLPEGYIDDLESVYGRVGAQRVIEGFAGFTPEGPPVYTPPFSHEIHVGEPRFLRTLPLIRSWDFGFRHPAVVFSQLGACQRGTVHWMILASLDEKFEIEAEQLWTEVKAFTSQVFPESHPLLTVDCGDRAGSNRNDAGPGPVTRLARPPFNLHIKTRVCSLANGIELVVRRLRSKCPCGAPVVYVHRRCGNLIDALSGGYHFSKGRPGKAPGEKPVKDEFYDDIADALRYGAENYLRPALLRAGRGTLQQLDLTRPPPRKLLEEPWQWMIGRDWR